LLAVAFIVLKLCGVIDWAWGWVLAPLWIPTLLVLTAFAVAGVVFIVRGWLAEGRRRRARKRAAETDNDHRSRALHGPVRKWGYRPADVERMRLHADRVGRPHDGLGRNRADDREES
jgi:hypothetical protein